MGIIQEHLLPFIEDKNGGTGSFFLLEDNCGPHRALEMGKYMALHGVQRLDWAPQSPDMNAIENLWAMLEARPRDRPQPLTTLDGLFDALCEEWARLPDSYLSALWRSMPDRCSTNWSGLVPGHRAGGAGVGRSRSPPTHGPGVPSGHGHCAHTGPGAVRCEQPGLAARSRGRRACAGRRLCRAASAPAWSHHRPPRQVGAPGPDSPSYLLTALGDLSCIVVSCIGWSAARANSH